MLKHHYFFAGGGTGGHIYPAIAVAEQIAAFEPDAEIMFFCSDREIDSQILSKTGFKFIALPARVFSANPRKLISFWACLLQSYCIARKTIAGNRPAVLLGTGGFASAGPILAAHKLKVPIGLLNTDAVPGRANKMLARFANEIFVQFAETAKYFVKIKAKVSVTGCPLRGRFANPDRQAAIRALGLDENKKTLLITGASSGAESINNALCALLEKLANFVSDWQIVHIAGRAHFEDVKKNYQKAKIRHKVLDYCEQMPEVLAAADLVIGRSGAVSVAEYAAAGVPSICMPYPHHKDMQQYLNAAKLVGQGAAVMVEDKDSGKNKAERLWQELQELMINEKKRQGMRRACGKITNLSAAAKIAERLNASL